MTSRYRGRELTSAEMLGYKDLQQADGELTVLCVSRRAGGRGCGRTPGALVGYGSGDNHGEGQEMHVSGEGEVKRWEGLSWPLVPPA